MRRTTVFLDEALLKKAQQYARRTGKSFATVVREALMGYLTQGAGRNAELPSIAGRFASGRTDTSERVDELLWKDPHT
jgi:predicted transcriptional regulator